ncbi:hypothetical protein EG327_005592 [Venturia inaequalis]|uniref:Vacuolar protein sorting-associated protein 8 central domain-containing protein n=1 Tax=Venturia inaequalis TaxID=5025 RepID=A0A8H3V8N3_VENIN|nr:hypothetical protein EG327_005592 [Venturia inaequalis]
MSSSSDDDDASPDNTEVASNRLLDNVQRKASNGGDSDAESFSRTRSPDLVESGTVTPTPDINGTSFQGHGQVKKQEEEESVASSELAPLTEDARSGQVQSPEEGSEQTLETPDDTPSLKESILSSPGSSKAPSRISLAHRHRPGALQPFERRFSARLTPSPLASPRTTSPAFLNAHSRQTSVNSILLQSQDGSEADTPQPPWEVVRWTKLKKITGTVFSETGRRNYGRPTVISIGASIAVGTSKGLALIFDYHQSLSATIGLGTKAVESGTVTALAISADHSTIATGHASGNIFTWELSRPAKPFLHIPPIERSRLAERASDGHVSGSAVVHVGFLGTRHTALVSADEGGMAFSHLATRGFGAVARIVKTTRILGRYPTVPVPVKLAEKPRKPSSVLAFSPLPLGNVEQPTDDLGLTALLTPYLLVIVSTTPIAETQFKSPRPKDVEPHSTLSGCLAWFPAVKLRRPIPGTNQTVSKTKLVYCWSNILTILDVDAVPSQEKDKLAVVNFRPRSRWKSEEAIVAVQWLGRSVLGVLTISQRLIILEDTSLRTTDSFDLLHKHIYHQDLFSRQLQPVVEQLDEEDASMHGVVADAFHMSFRAYKGRLFLLGFNDVSVGTLSNWADRLVALMEEGDYIAAIRLATSYHSGDADKITVGLPEDDESRHTLVQEKLLEMITASLKYTFAGTDFSDDGERRLQFKDLATASFMACMSMNEIEFLFEEVYEVYEQASVEEIFFEVLEPYILDEEITSIPPDVLKDLISQYASNDRAKRLEEMICRLDTGTMDLHQTTTLCKQHGLYDALIYVWNQAIRDYITPFIDLLSLIKLIQLDEANANNESLMASAMKIFPYMAYTFTGRVYPSGVEMDESDAHRAKAEMYGFLFSGRIISWPPGSGVEFETIEDTDDEEPPYPYLSLILRFDTPSFMSMLNEAFEDHFLNGTSDSNGTTNGGGAPTLLPTRQTIISILLDVLRSDEFDAEDSIYLDMFIARNLPKFAQFILLPGSTIRNVLEGLCDYPSDDVAEDCQLSVEYLLSFYHPTDLASLIPLFRQAEFFRVLKSVYAGSKQYPQLIETYFADTNDKETVFDTIGDCIRPKSGLTSKERRDVEAVIVKNAATLASINTVRTAEVLRDYAPHLVEPVLDRLEEDSQAQFILLRTLIEPALHDDSGTQQASDLGQGFDERYVQLMCKYDPTHVADYVELLKSGDLRLDRVLPAMESSGVIDAAVVLMARDGLARKAMDRLVKHMQTLETALTGLISAAAESPDAGNTTETADDLLDAVQKYAKVGIWLCQGQTKATDHSKKEKKKKPNLKDPEADLSLDERLWLDLIDIIVVITKEVSSVVDDLPADSSLEGTKITSSLRTTVQTAFSALLTSTTRPKLLTKANIPTIPATQPHPTFLLILRAFLTRASRSSPSLSDLRSVLQDIFAAYTFEETILDLANQFLDKDLFGIVDQGWRLRQRGWRAKGLSCEKCKRRVWGPGVGGDVWGKWEERVKEEERVKREKREGVLELQRRESEGKIERGKGRAVGLLPAEDEPPLSKGQVDGAGDDETQEGISSAESRKEPDPGPLVIFACRHVWHRTCLEQAMEIAIREGRMHVNDMGTRARDELRCPIAHQHQH